MFAPNLVVTISFCVVIFRRAKNAFALLYSTLLALVLSLLYCK